MKELLSETWNTDEKIYSNNRDNYIHQNKEIKEKLWSVAFIYVWIIFEHQVKDLYASQKFQLFLVFSGQKHISGTRRATNKQVHQQAPLTSFRTQLLHCTKWNLKRLLTQNFEYGQIGFQN